MPDPKQSRLPGRAFDDPSQPLGADLIANAPADRSYVVYDHATPHEYPEPHGVSDRAKAVAVLRKAEELMRTNNPAPINARMTRRALELAAGRIGISLHEYDALVTGDPGLEELERRVIADAIARLVR
jgi:hypothetical protein